MPGDQKFVQEAVPGPRGSGICFEKARFGVLFGDPLHKAAESNSGQLARKFPRMARRFRGEARHWLYVVSRSLLHGIAAVVLF